MTLPLDRVSWPFLLVSLFTRKSFLTRHGYAAFSGCAKNTGRKRRRERRRKSRRNLANQVVKLLMSTWHIFESDQNHKDRRVLGSSGWCSGRIACTGPLTLRVLVFLPLDWNSGQRPGLKTIRLPLCIDQTVSSHFRRYVSLIQWFFVSSLNVIQAINSYSRSKYSQSGEKNETSPCMQIYPFLGLQDCLT